MTIYSGDTPTKTLNISAMSDDDIDALLNAIRERRMEPVRHYQEAQRLEREKRQSKLAERLRKEIEMFERELARADKAIDKLDARSVKIRAVRLEMDFEHVGEETE